MASMWDWMNPLGYGSTEPADVSNAIVPGDAEQAAQNKGGLAGLMAGLQGNAQTMIGMGMGLMSGDSRQDAWRNAMVGAQRGTVLDASARKEKKAEEEAAKRRAAYMQLGQRLGLPAEAMQDPDLAQKLIAQRMTPDDGQVIGNAETGYYRVFADGRKQEIVPGRGAEPDTFAKREAQADRYGLKGEERQRFVLTGGLTELTKPIPAELAARAGMAENFLSESPAVRKQIEAGDATGVWDAAKGWAGVGEQGAIARHVESGKDALIRNLTGAGMPASEAAQYASRYNISPTDSAKTALDKYDRLVAELQAIRAKTYEGRGTPPDVKPKESVGQYIGSPGGGQTKSGVKWSIEGQ